MKSTGIVRRVDELGRVVLPIELRHKFGITEKDPLEVWVQGKDIILRKYENECTFCGSQKDVKEVLGKLVCKSCQKKLLNELGK